MMKIDKAILRYFSIVRINHLILAIRNSSDLDPFEGDSTFHYLSHMFGNMGMDRFYVCKDGEELKINLLEDKPKNSLHLPSVELKYIKEVVDRYDKNLNRKCDCDSKDLLDYGCRCGGN